MHLLTITFAVAVLLLYPRVSRGEWYVDWFNRGWTKGRKGAAK